MATPVNSVSSNCNCPPPQPVKPSQSNPVSQAQPIKSEEAPNRRVGLPTADLLITFIILVLIVLSSSLFSLSISLLDNFDHPCFHCQKSIFDHFDHHRFNCQQASLIILIIIVFIVN
jgi:hypothetical protein